MTIKARRCTKCGNPTGSGHAMFCPGCRPRRGRRSRLDMIRDSDGKFLLRHTSRGLGFDPGAVRKTSPLPWEVDDG